MKFLLKYREEKKAKELPQAYARFFTVHAKPTHPESWVWQHDVRRRVTGTDHGRGFLEWARRGRHQCDVSRNGVDLSEQLSDLHMHPSDGHFQRQYEEIGRLKACVFGRRSHPTIR